MRLQPLTPLSTDVNTSAHVKIAGGLLVANDFHLQIWIKRPTDCDWQKRSILLFHPFLLTKLGCCANGTSTHRF
uniref:RxLR effector candidate protein n=1 Tax=Hyaloperonospora arabidopsidis (strain Emoy2) TaxID=559515 RepID=M4B7K1_HYAAE